MNTREQIKTEFLKLIASSSFDKVRISTICKNVNIQRKLFYYYFEDKYALLNDIYQDDLTLNFNISETTKINWKNGAKLLLETYKSRGTFYKNSITVDNNQWHDLFLTHMRALFIRLFNELAANDAENFYFNATFFSNGWTGIIENWIIDDFDIDIAVLIDQFYALIHFTKFNISKWE